MFFPAWHASTDSSVKGIASQLERRRHAVANRWNLDSELVLIGAGDPIPIPGRADRTYPFRSHSEYFYLTDRERPAGVLAFDPHDGWVDFVTEVTRDERLWEGGSSAATDGIPMSGLEPSLARSFADTRVTSPGLTLHRANSRKCRLRYSTSSDRPARPRFSAVAPGPNGGRFTTRQQL